MSKDISAFDHQVRAQQSQRVLPAVRQSETRYDYRQEAAQPRTIEICDLLTGVFTAKNTCLDKLLFDHPVSSCVLDQIVKTCIGRASAVKKGRIETSFFGKGDELSIRRRPVFKASREESRSSRTIDNRLALRTKLDTLNRGELLNSLPE